MANLAQLKKLTQRITVWDVINNNNTNAIEKLLGIDLSSPREATLTIVALLAGSVTLALDETIENWIRFNRELEAKKTVEEMGIKPWQ